MAPPWRRLGQCRRLWATLLTGPAGPSKTQVRPSRGRLPSSCPAWSIKWSDRPSTINMLVSTTDDSPSRQTRSPPALRAVMQPSRASCRSSLRRSTRAAVSTVTAATSAQYVAAGAHRPPHPGHRGHPGSRPDPVPYQGRRELEDETATHPMRGLASHRRTRAAGAKDRGTPTHGPDGPRLSRRRHADQKVHEAREDRGPRRAHTTTISSRGSLFGCRTRDRSTDPQMPKFR